MKTKILSVLLVAVMLIGVMPSFTVSLAASVDDLTFTLNSNNQSYYVSGCSSSASGSLDIPATYNGKPVTRIGEYAFFNLQSLTSVTIPNSVTTIDDCAFLSCLGLESITIPDSVLEIGDNAFEGSSGLESVAIPSSVITIGTAAFFGCTSLTGITVDSGNTKYSSVDGVLFNKDKTELITYPIGKLNEAYLIPTSVTNIVSGAFRRCTNLTSITIPDTVEVIGSDAFVGCTGLTSITIPHSVTSISSSEFVGCSALTEIIVAADNTVYSSVDGVLFNKNQTELLAYPDNKPDVNYSVPNTVTTIVSTAFQNNPNLTSVTLSNSLSTLEGYMFSNCSALQSITIPGSVTSIHTETFNSCTALTEIIVATDNDVYSSVFGVLYNKTKTELVAYPAGRSDTSYSVPNTVEKIKSKAFADCDNLTSITLPSSVSSIDDYAFYNCDDVIILCAQGSFAEQYATENSIPYGTVGEVVTYELNDGIETYKVTNCDSKAYGEIVIPEEYNSSPVTGIDALAFSGCTLLTGVTIPDSVTSIGEDAFSGCTNLIIYCNKGSYAEQYATANGITCVAIDTNLTFVLDMSRESYYVSECGVAASGEIVIPSKYMGMPVTQIGFSSFGDCTGVTSVVIPDSVTSIADFAFRGCTGLESITLSASVTDVGYDVFYDCSSLNSINVAAGNTVYSSIDGVLLNKDKTALIMYPAAKSGTSYVIPNSVETIYGFAFCGCAELESITISASVTDIREDVFYDCSSLNSINVVADNTVYSSIDGVLLNKDKTELILYPVAKSGTSYVIPNSVETIYGYAFCGCAELESITVSASVTGIGDGAFLGCTSLNSINVVADNTVYSSIDGVLLNKDKTELILYPAAKSGEVYVIPDSVESIYTCAFSDCINLTSITIPAYVTAIGEIAFIHSLSLNSINVSADNTAYSSVDGVLFDKNKTELITYPSGKSDTSYTVPSSVESIKARAFSYNDSLTSVTLLPSVLSMDFGTFFNCDSVVIHCYHDSFAEQYAIDYDLQYVTVGNNLTYELNDGIETYKVTNCMSNAYGEIVIPEEYNSSPVTNIGDSAFSGCTQLTGISIPDSVTSIEENAFEGCDNLIIYCNKGSYAEQYATANGITCVAIDTNLVFELNEDGESYCVSECYDTASGEIVIPAKYMGKPVTIIDCYAFYECTEITGIVISDSVTCIDDYAFENCTALESVTIPASVTDMGYDPFVNCESLESVNVAAGNPEYSSVDGVLLNKDKTVLIMCPIAKSGGVYEVPNSVENISGYAFYGNLNITSITIPASVTEIGECALNYCKSLNSINVSADNTEYSSIDGVVFNKDKTTLLIYPGGKVSNNYVFPSTVTSIEEYAFMGSVGLKGVTISSEIDTINYSAFYECVNLTSVTISDSVETIMQYAFYGCSALETITIPDTVLSIETGAFYDCSSLKTVKLSESLTLLDELLFSNCTSLESITIPDSVETIKQSAFNCCSALETVTIPDTVLNIETGAFYDCTSLKTVKLSESLTLLDCQVFSNCTALESITIPDSVEALIYGTFCGCTALENITISDNVTRIDGDVFGDTAWLNNQPDGVVYINNMAYLYKGQMPDDTSIVIRDGTKVINNGLFDWSSELTSITFPDSLTTIGDSAFHYCVGLTSITIPDSVTSIGESAFESCLNLVSITIPDSVTSIGGGAFCGCTELKSVRLPNSLTAINSKLFDYCVRLNSVTIPNSVTSIGDWAFTDCYCLNNITIPESVTDIKSTAFGGSHLNKIYCYENSVAHSFAQANNYGFELLRIRSASVDTSVVGQNSYIFTVKEDTTVLSNLVTAVDGFTAQGTPARGTMYGTGSTVRVYDAQNEPVSTYTTVLQGDLDGSGTVDALDCMFAELASSGHRTLTDTEDPTGAFRAANDINLDGEYDGTDLAVIMSKAVK